MVDERDQLFHRLEAEVAKTKKLEEELKDAKNLNEDLVRDIALRLDADSRVRSYKVEAENFESIHNHSAYALVERIK